MLIDAAQRTPASKGKKKKEKTEKKVGKNSTAQMKKGKKTVAATVVKKTVAAKTTTKKKEIASVEVSHTQGTGALLNLPKLYPGVVTFRPSKVIKSPYLADVKLKRG